MKQQKGFTLIELIIVIVILGILAVTAAPRFFDFSSDARKSTLGALAATIKGAAEVGYAKSAIDGSPKYPAGTEISGFLSPSSLEDWHYVATDATATVAVFSAKDNAGAAIDECKVTYTVIPYAAAGADPVAEPEVLHSFKVSIADSGC